MDSKKIIIGILIIAFFVAIFGNNREELIEETPEETVEQEECTERTICTDENTKAMRKSDCSLDNVEPCSNGCEAGECLPEQVQTPAAEEVSTPVQEDCELAFVCLDANRKGYQKSDCTYSNVDACQYGCEAGKCLRASQVEVAIPEKEVVTSGTATFDILAWRFFDFDQGLILVKDNYDYDVKMRYFPQSNRYNYFIASGFSNDIWVIDKPFAEASHKDCVDGVQSAVSYGRLRTQQTLCIETREKTVAAIGGEWEGYPGRLVVLNWKLFEE